MDFDPPLQTATLIRRYKRFLADVRLPDGQLETLHCANTGSMTNCQPEGAQVWYSDSRNSKRKYRYSLEAVQVAHGHWVGVNTSRASKLVTEAILAGKLRQLHGFSSLKPEVAFGESRLDLALYYQSRLTTLIEVKNVTLGPASCEPDNGLVSFPDAVTVRGQKHLKELIAVRASGLRAILFFFVCNIQERKLYDLRMKWIRTMANFCERLCA